MRFLTDQDVYHVTVQWLKDQSYEVVTAAELGLASASDEELLKKIRPKIKSLAAGTG